MTMRPLPENTAALTIHYLNLIEEAIIHSDLERVKTLLEAAEQKMGQKIGEISQQIERKSSDYTATTVNTPPKADIDFMGRVARYFQSVSREEIPPERRSQLLFLLADAGFNLQSPINEQGSHLFYLLCMENYHDHLATIVDLTVDGFKNININFFSSTAKPMLAYLTSLGFRNFLLPEKEPFMSKNEAAYLAGINYQENYHKEVHLQLGAVLEDSPTIIDKMVIDYLGERTLSIPYRDDILTMAEEKDVSENEEDPEAITKHYFQSIQKAITASDLKEVKTLLDKAEQKLGQKLGKASREMRIERFSPWDYMIRADVNFMAGLSMYLLEQREKWLEIAPSLLFLLAEAEFDLHAYSLPAPIPDRQSVFSSMVLEQLYDNLALIAELTVARKKMKEVNNVFSHFSPEKMIAYLSSLGFRLPLEKKAELWGRANEKREAYDIGIKYGKDYKEEVQSQLAARKLSSPVLNQIIIDYLGKQTFSMPPLENPRHYTPKSDSYLQVFYKSIKGLFFSRNHSPADDKSNSRSLKTTLRQKF